MGPVPANTGSPVHGVLSFGGRLPTMIVLENQGLELNKIFI